jgi:hypothetical protein
MFGIGCVNPSFIIYVGILMLILGAMIYYCNMRFQIIESAVMKQNAVLTSFIANVQREIRFGGAQNTTSISAATPEACVAAAQLSIQKTDASRKIEVSDDSESEDDTNSESETEDDDNDTDSQASDEDDIEKKINIKEIILEPIVINIGEKLSDIRPLLGNDIKVIDLETMEFKLPVVDRIDFEHENSVKIEKLESESESDPDSESESGLSEDEEDGFEIKKMYSKTSQVKVKPSAAAAASAKKTSVPDTDDKIFENMRVEELRKLALEKSLASKEDLKKIKKAELIVMLNKYKA